MALYKRKNTWWISFTTASGQRVRCSARTENKAAAQELHDKLRAESWHVEQLQKKPLYTWDEAALRWMQETAHKRSHLADVKKLQWLQQYFSGMALVDITRERVAKIAELKYAGKHSAAANRVLALIRAILRRAANEWEWIERAPHVRLYHEPKKRIRWLTQAQAERLIAELPEHLAEMARFSLATGLRQANVLGLRWSQVDKMRRVAWIHAEQAKAGKDIHVTLNATALAVLERQLGAHPEYVFTFRGRSIKQATTKAWYKALERAGIKDFHWHDLRHTWASWHAQNGTPLNVLQEMGGWESAAMVQRYAHLCPERFGAYAEKIDALIPEVRA